MQTNKLQQQVLFSKLAFWGVKLQIVTMFWVNVDLWVSHHSRSTSECISDELCVVGEAYEDLASKISETRNYLMGWVPCCLEGLDE